jgi:cytochrome c553
MKKFSFYLIIFLSFSQYSFADYDVANLIVENCTACHNLKNYNNKTIPSIKNLKKAEFIKIMKRYKNENENNVMNRISKALTTEDIVNISEIIYNEN